MTGLAVRAAGMVTGVGLTAAATCAAFRCAVSRFVETRFVDEGGEWVIGSPVPLDPPWRGRARLIHLITSAVRECLEAAGGAPPERVPLLLCVAEPDRPGRPVGLDDAFLGAVQEGVGRRFHRQSRVFAQGRVGGVRALEAARILLADADIPFCLVAGVDTLLTARALEAYEGQRRLLTSRNSDGFIPGEAGAAVLVASSRRPGPELGCLALGFGQEKAIINSGEPLRADGLVQAFRTLFADGGVTLDDADYRYTGCNGEQYYFREDRLALSRTIRRLKARFDHLHPADCVGEIGAALVPCMLGLALDAARKGYAPGRGALCHVGNDDGARAALLLRYDTEGEP